LHADALTAGALTIWGEAVRVLNKLERTLQLAPEVLCALQQGRADIQARLALEQGKRFLAAGEIDRATASLLQASAYFRTPKLRLVLLGLRIAPSLVALGVRDRGRWGPEAGGWGGGRFGWTRGLDARYFSRRAHSACPP